MRNTDPSPDRTLWLAVLHEAFEDLKRHRECTCVDPDTYRCNVCATDLDPWDEHGHCRHSTIGAHRVFCRHRFKSARRFLLGMTPEWQAQLEYVCGFAGVDVERVKARALKMRRRDAA